ncbi:MAG TPA: hypothetical protein VMR18_05050 [Candidatus Saccharimonadales bacterium]|nr:hypothetical protein [Candidatus Saccharimonadales bacterium]
MSETTDSEILEDSELTEIRVGSGVCLGFGGSNTRYAVCEGGEITDFEVIDTPQTPNEFFGWVATHIVEAAEAGNKWLVAGYPGPVNADGTKVGPMVNVPGLADEEYHVFKEVLRARPEIRGHIEEGFSLVNVHDGSLAAHAASIIFGENKPNRVAALIVGTGVGAGIVDRDPRFQEVFRADHTQPLELGHFFLSAIPSDTPENNISGPALERKYGIPAPDLPPGHQAWREVGVGVGQLATILGFVCGAELVVPCGGVGAGGSEKYQDVVIEMLLGRTPANTTQTLANATQELLMPRVMFVPPSMGPSFELYGAEGVMGDVYTRIAAGAIAV